MGKEVNIIIADESALFFYEHVDSPGMLGATPTRGNPFLSSASSANDFTGFNPAHPLYGGAPVILLVNDPALRRKSASIKCRCCLAELPQGSFLKLRDNIYLASPELVFARMGNFVSEVRLAEIGLNLCARYFKNLTTGKIDDRHSMLTTPDKIRRYLDKVPDLRGSEKGKKALRWVIPNSGSPEESKMKIQYGNPLWSGGMNLPFTHMNYDIRAGRLAKLTEQDSFCIDFANPELKRGMEYDGEYSHQDPSKDKRRINALDGMGWRVFPIDKTVLYDPEATKKAGLQIARNLGFRIRFPEHWQEKYEHLRKELKLPI